MPGAAHHAEAKRELPLRRGGGGIGLLPHIGWRGKGDLAMVTVSDFKKKHVREA